MSDLPPVPPGALPGGAPPATYPSGPPLAPPPPPVPPGSLRPGSPWSDHGGLPPAPPSGPRPWVVVAAILAVLALVAATFAAFAGDDEPAEQSTDRRPHERDETPAPTDPATPTTPESTPGTAPAPTDDIAAVVEDIQAFVEAERGLTFLTDVEVELAADEEFEARLLEDFAQDEDDMVTDGRVFEALGLVEPGTDYVAAVRTLRGAGVVGFYDPTTSELVVRGTAATPYVRSVIAHELTHALDDQHFGLDRPELEDVDERGFGFTGLVEGNARRIEDAYRATFTAAEEAEAFAEELAIGGDADLFSIPLVLIELLLAPYVLGPDLIEAILDDGGQARLDAAFTDPPSTSEHLLAPETFLAGDDGGIAFRPDTDGGAPFIDEGVLGALGLAELLGQSPVLLPGPLDPAVEGWGADRYVAWADTDGSGTCVRVMFEGDTPADSEEIGSALEDWAASAPFGVTATVAADAAGRVTLTSCSV